MKRVLVLVDGFNLFHAVNELSPGFTELDVRSLASRLINRRTEEIVGVEYFASLITHLNKQTIQTQERYLHALRGSGVNVILGRFRPRTSVCPRCNLRVVRHVEKETDVNLATALVAHAFDGTCDRVLLFSADSDMKGAIALVKARFPNIDIRLVSTVRYLQPVYRSIGTLVDGQIRLSYELVKNHQFERRLEGC
jgi:uncharacterized LabA/DUF88 family protein